MSNIATIAIPTLLADTSLDLCIAALRAQSRQDFETVVIDNSGCCLASSRDLGNVRVLTMARNIGFGAAVNRAFEQSSAPYLITLNDDAVPAPGWLEALLGAAEADPAVGMCASQVQLQDHSLDSAGMLIYGDGSSMQRGHGEAAASYLEREEVLLPSASAALYRRVMLEQIGLFDEELFLYCEDTDLGLRARWAGWRCMYVPLAVVEHRYSYSSGRVSTLKAYYVERNRMLVAMKNFPPGMLLRVPVFGTARYLAHFRAAFAGTGKSAEFRRESGGLLAMAGIVAKAHVALLLAAGRIWRQRAAIRRTARITSAEFSRLLAAHSTSAGELARH